VSFPQDVPQPVTDELRLVQEISRLVLGIGDRLRAEHAAKAAEFGLTAAQAKVLTAIGPDEALPMRALAGRLRCDPSNLTGMVDRLEKRGLIERRPDRVDRRVKALVLTDGGRELRSRFWERVTQDPGPFRGLTPEQLATVRDHLRSVAADGPLPEPEFPGERLTG
jgi:DNA-binding MarR family transcriptional regulator